MLPLTVKITGTATKKKSNHARSLVRNLDKHFSLDINFNFIDLENSAVLPVERRTVIVTLEVLEYQPDLLEGDDFLLDRLLQHVLLVHLGVPEKIRQGKDFVFGIRIFPDK